MLLALTHHFRTWCPDVEHVRTAVFRLAMIFVLMSHSQLFGGVVSASEYAQDPDRFSTSSPIRPDDSTRTDSYPPGSDTQIHQLIEQLNSDSFVTREQATVELVRLGKPAIGPLARQSFDCSPEACWRIRKTLEEICVAGDESVLYKTAGILIVRFQSSDESIAARLVDLEARWRRQRQETAIERMRELGAEVENPWEGIDFASVGPAGGNHVIINGQGIVLFDVFNPGLTEPASSDRPLRSRPLRSENEQLSKINEILESSLEKNRAFVFETNSIRVSPSPSAIRPRIFINRFARNASIGADSITVVLGEHWTGTAADLTTLNNIEKLGVVRFENQSLARETLAVVADLDTLQKLTLDHCEFPQSVFSAVKWKPALLEIAFVDQEITAKLIESCSHIGMLQVISFDHCDVVDGALQALNKITSLRELEFKETEIHQSTFDALTKLKTLQRLRLTVCKFKTTDYRRLEQSRPALQIVYSGQALLGIRAVPENVFGLSTDESSNDSGCEVMEVVAQSGADSAGIIVGDVIKKIDGQKIETFDDLRLHIAQHFAGDELDVEIQRKGQPLNVKVRLTKMIDPVIR